MTQFLDYEGLKTFAKTIDSKFVRKDGIDTTFAEVVTSLPTDVTKIKKHLYLVKNGSTESQNAYSEYIYIGEIGTGKTYDASKWEKLGEFKASIDLSGYATKAQAVGTINKSVGDTYVQLTSTHVDESLGTSVMIEAASASHAGVMTVDNFNKLQGIATGANKTIVDSTLSSTSTNPVQNKVINSNLTTINNELGKKATKDVATTSANGLMASTDKVKLDGIAAGANKTVVDSTLSTNSTNPVQNKAIKTALDGKADSDNGLFTVGVGTPELIINATTADSPSKNKIYATGATGTADIIIQHANSTGAVDDVVKVNVDGIVVNEHRAAVGAIGDVNDKDWTLTGSKTQITGTSITSPKFVKTGGTPNEILMADGSVATPITTSQIQALFD